MSISVVDLQLPWSVSESDDKKFKRLLLILIACFLFIALVIPFLPVDEISREQKEALPPQLARVIMEKKALPPPPPPPKPKPVEKKSPEVKPEKKVAEKPKPKPKQQAIEKAKATAAVSGLLAFQDDLADMRDSLNVEELTNKPVSNAGNTATKIERSVITSKAAQGSGGIAVSKLSRNVGGGSLATRDTTTVDAMDTDLAKADNSKEPTKTGTRSEVSIRRVMDKNKAAIFSIYNRALRKDPSLEGQFVFEMLISPNGQISTVKLISSELGDTVLDNKILSRIRLINFGKADVLPTTVNYSFDFVPY